MSYHIATISESFNATMYIVHNHRIDLVFELTKNFDQFSEIFKEEYRQKIDTILEHRSYSIREKLTENVKAYWFVLAQNALEVSVNKRCVYELVQVFDDNDFKNKLQRILFEAVV